MGIDDTQEPRLTRGLPNDDPTLGEVSAFLERVDAAYAGLSTARCESAHVAAITQEARTVRNGPQTSRRKTMKDLFSFKPRRLVVGSVMAALIMLSGVGVASAVVGGSIPQLWPAAPAEAAPTPEPTETVPVADPTPSASTTADDEDADDQSEHADDQSSEAADHSEHADDQNGETADDSEHADEPSSDDDEHASSQPSQGSHDDGDDEADGHSADDTND